MFAELERCAHCHQRYPTPFGHRCPQASFAAQREQEFEHEFRSWLETNEGRFAEYLARNERSG
ncbi:MAG: hypothetical protein ACRDOP_01630 [Gaiellaceae bacterium]